MRREGRRAPALPGPGPSGKPGEPKRTPSIQNEDPVKALGIVARRIGEREADAVGDHVRAERDPARIVEVILVFDPITLSWNCAEGEGEIAAGQTTDGLELRPGKDAHDKSTCTGHRRLAVIGGQE